MTRFLRACTDRLSFFFFNDTATTEIYTLSLHDALPILPARILALDQCNLLFSAPAFELLFAGDGIANVVETFPIHEPGAMVGAGEAVECPALVLTDAAVDVVGDADVERAGAAGEDVDPIVMLHGENSWEGSC